MDVNYLKPTSEPDKYKDNGKWFKILGKRVAAQYDKQFYRAGGYINGGIGGLGQQPQNIGTWNYLGGSPVNAIWEYYRYFNTMQDNVQFGFATADYDNNALPWGTSWQRGQKIRQLVKDLAGNLMNTFQNASTEVRSVTPAAVNRKTKLLELTTIYKELEPYFRKLEEQGAGFSPLGGKEIEFESLDEAQNYIKFNYKEKMEMEGHYILEDLKSRNDFTNFFYECLVNALIGGVIAVKPYVKAGKVCWRLYNGTQVIWDNTIDSQHHRKDQQFMGIVRYMTPAEILTEHGEEMQQTEEGREMYKRISELSIENYTDYENFSGTMLPSVQRDGNFNIFVTVIDAWWYTCKDTRYAVRKNEEYGTEYVVKLKDDAEGEKTDFWWNTWYKTTLIGNLGQVNYGEETNLVENFEDRKIVEPPLVIWTPDMIMGYAQSLVGQMTQNQDLIDYYKNTIIAAAARSLGKVFTFHADVLNKKTVKDLANDFKRYGMTVVSTQDGDDPESGKAKLGEAYDLTLDPNVIMYDNLIKREEELMNNAASASEISLGQQSGYISLNSQMATINQNEKGIFGLKMGFMKFILQTLQLSVNQQKNIIAKYNNEYGIPITTEFGQQYLQATEGLSLEDMQIYLRFTDALDKETRDRLIGVVERFASDPNSGITMLDVGKMYQFKTITEMVRYFEDVAKKSQDRKTEAEQLNMQLQAELEAMKQEAAMQQAVLREQAANDRNDANNETKLTETMLKAQPAA